MDFACNSIHLIYYLFIRPYRTMPSTEQSSKQDKSLLGYASEFSPWCSRKALLCWHPWHRVPKVILMARLNCGVWTPGRCSRVSNLCSQEFQKNCPPGSSSLPCYKQVSSQPTLYVVSVYSNTKWAEEISEDAVWILGYGTSWGLIDINDEFPLNLPSGWAPWGSSWPVLSSVCIFM